jgi:integrase/recombinase XerD
MSVAVVNTWRVNTDLAGGRDAWAGIARAWLAEVEQRTGSTRTPVEYGRYLDRFATRLAAYGRTLDTATPADAHAFAYAPLPDARRGGALGKDPGPASVNVRLAALRSFYDFAQRLGIVAANPADRVKRPRLPEPTPKGLAPAHVRALLAATPDNDTGARDRAIILTAVLTGLRREELIGLTKGAITFADDGAPMYEARTKGGKLRRRELPGPAWDAIRAYLDAAGRPFAALDDDARLFPVTSQTLYENLRRYGERIGLDGLTVHTLRHTAAKLRRQAGASLEEVQAVLGHSSIATTARYLARLEGVRDPGWQAAAALLDAPAAQP